MFGKYPAPIGVDPTAGYDEVDMGMHRQPLSPGMQYPEEADLSSQPLPISAKGQQRFGGGIKEEAVDRLLIEETHGEDDVGQGENHMIIRHRKEIVEPLFHPLTPSASLALGAVPVPAGIIGQLDVSAAVTAVHMITQIAAAAALDGAHDGLLFGGQRMRGAIRVSIGTKHISDFIPGSGMSGW